MILCFLPLWTKLFPACLLSICVVCGFSKAWHSIREQDEKWWPPPLLSTSQNKEQEGDSSGNQWSGSSVPPPPAAPPTLGTGLALKEDSAECLILDWEPQASGCHCCGGLCKLQSTLASFTAWAWMIVFSSFWFFAESKNIQAWAPKRC